MISIIVNHKRIVLFEPIFSLRTYGGHYSCKEQKILAAVIHIHNTVYFFYCHGSIRSGYVSQAGRECSPVG